MKYSKRRNQSYKMPEMDKDYVLNNLDLAVRLLDEYGLELLGPMEMGLEPKEGEKEWWEKFREENYKKPDFSGEDRAFLNKYGPTLKEIEGE